jgi:hypothetical protein
MMLKVINLYVIDRILKQVAHKKIPALSQMFYINCLMHHFRDLEATPENASAFQMFESDFVPYVKFVGNLQDLHKAGLIDLGARSINFHNYWGQFIDKSLLTQKTKEAKQIPSGVQPASVYAPLLKESEALVEHVMMRHKLTKKRVFDLLDLFSKEQAAFDKKYNNEAECKKHFSSWVEYNKDKAPKEQVKSGGKLLGLE